MKGLAQIMRTVILFVGILGCLADKSKKPLKKFPAPPFGPHMSPTGHKFLPAMHLPPIPPHQLASISPQTPNPTDPYACLPKFLCIVQNKKGEKRTTILHGLHPALRKAKPSVIDPSTLPKVPGGAKPFAPSFSSSESSDDEMFRDREFNDSFLKQQEMAENMAFLEEKRRQFLYQQGHRNIKSKIIPKGGEKPVEDDDTKSKESEEEEEKSQEVSKEDKQEESEKSIEVSKEEEKEEPEESAEDEASSESQAQVRSKLNKYKLKKKAYANKKRSGIKSRIDEFEDVDTLDDHLATVPWDDRINNDSDPLKPKEIYDKLFRKVLPFQIPSLPKIAKSIPGMSFLATEADDEEEVTTTTTQRPGLLKRMFKAVTGTSDTAEPPVKKRNGKPVRRYKRDTEENLKLVSEDAKIIKQIRDPARQCRMIYKGCDLPYDHIMKMVSSGQVLIENDDEVPTTKKPAQVDSAFAQDDEADQAIRDKQAHKKSKPIPQMLAQAHLGGKKKFTGPNGMSGFGKNKKPVSEESDEDTHEFERPRGKKPVASLPLLPMRYQWGKPTYTVHGKPTYGNGPADFSGGIMDPTIYRTPPPPPPMVPTTTTTEKPIFGTVPLDKKDNHSTSFQHSVIKLNKTHTAHVLKKKPYNPPKTRTRDDKGRPVSFNTVFTEIAGNTGGIHDFFDRISGAFGGDGTRESGRELTSTFPGSNTDVHGNPEGLPNSPHAKPTAFPQSPMPDDAKEDDDGESAERDDEDGSDEEEEDDDGNDREEEADEGNDQEEEADDGNEREEEEEDDDEEKDEIADEVEDPSLTSSKQKPQQAPSVATESEPYLLSVDKKTRPEKESSKQKPKDPAEEEEDEEEIEDDDEASISKLPDTIPSFIKQSMIEDFKKKQKEKEEGGEDDDEQDDGRPQHGGGHPQGGHGHGGRPGGPGARPSSLGLGSLFGRPSQGGLFGSGSQQYGQGSSGGMFGSQQQGQGSQGGGGLFSFLG